MTYEAYIRECQKRQRAYIRNERKRMGRLDRAWQRYVTAARAIGMHPLNRNEILDRFRELEEMERRVPISHGDSPAMRATWESRQ